MSFSQSCEIKMSFSQSCEIKYPGKLVRIREQMYPKLSSVLIAFDEGERIPNLVLGVLCYTARKN